MTVYDFLQGDIKKNNLARILLDNRLDKVQLEDFFNRFGEMRKEELISFLKDGKNAYEISVFGHRYNTIKSKKKELWS